MVWRLTKQTFVFRGQTPFGPSLGATLSKEIVDTLLLLGDEVLGTRLATDFGYETLSSVGNQFFPEDGVQGEEGLNFDSYLWGYSISPLPMNEAGLSSLAPVIMASSWPNVSPQPFQQGQTADQTETGPRAAYSKYLMSPPVQSWELTTAMPVEWYARYCQRSWWDGAFAKYGHQGLKLDSHIDQSTPLLRSTTAVILTRDASEVLSVLGEDTFLLFIHTIPMELGHKGLGHLADYLYLLGREAAESRIVAARFDNETQNWMYKNQEMTRIANEVTTSYRTMTAAMEVERGRADASVPLTVNNSATRLGRVNTLMKRALQDMLRFNMLLDQEISYQQDMINTYQQQSQEMRHSLIDRVAFMAGRINRIGALVDGKQTWISPPRPRK